MGLTPLSWTDIRDWSHLTGVSVTGLEAGTIKTLSSAYLSGYQDGKEIDSISPWSPNVTEEQRERVSNKIGSVLGRLAKKKKG